MKDVLAEAAERRIRDDRACHPQNEDHVKEVEVKIRKDLDESVGIESIDLTGDDSEDKEVKKVIAKEESKVEMDATSRGPNSWSRNEPPHLPTALISRMVPLHRRLQADRLQDCPPLRIDQSKQVAGFRRQQNLSACLWILSYHLRNGLVRHVLSSINLFPSPVKRVRRQSRPSW